MNKIYEYFFDVYGLKVRTMQIYNIIGSGGEQYEGTATLISPHAQEDYDFRVNFLFDVIDEDMVSDLTFQKIPVVCTDVNEMD